MFRRFSGRSHTSINRVGALLVFYLIICLTPSFFLAPVSSASAEPVLASSPPRGITGEVVQAESSRELLRSLAEGVQKIKLSNGLRVLFFPRRQSPVFEGQVWVKVGGVNEKLGSTGVSHLLEHMAFKGTETIGTKDYRLEKKLLAEYEELLAAEPIDAARIQVVLEKLKGLWKDNEFALTYQERGAVGLNAATGKDYTYYQVSLPSVEFELWCWMESDRLLSPVFRQFYKEREVVLEERKSRTDDNPWGKMYEALLASAYWAHPNRLPVIGWESDLAVLKTRDIEELHQQYYRPDNIVIALVGDLQIEKIRPLLEKYFGRIPSAKGEIPEVKINEPVQNGERLIRVRFDAEPRLMLAYHKPVYPNLDDLQFMLLHSVLSDGRSSILYRELVQERGLASSVSTSEAPGELYPSLFYVSGVPQRGVSNERLLDEIQKILDRMKSNPVTEADLRAAKKRVKVSLLSVLTSNGGLARSLARTELLWGDWAEIFTMYDAALKTEAEDLMRLARTYLNVENRTTVFLEKAEGK